MIQTHLNLEGTRRFCVASVSANYSGALQFYKVLCYCLVTQMTQLFWLTFFLHLYTVKEI